MLCRPFTLDLRALSVMRGLLGLLIIQDLLARASHFEAFYTDFGVMPAALARQLIPPYRFSAHALSGGFGPEAALFVLAGILALSMTVGFRTRLTAVLSFFLLGSLQARNPMIHQGGDDALRLLVLWSAFLPCDAYFSIDARRRPAPLANGWVSIGSIGLVAQLAFLYLFSAILKSGPTWRDGTAIGYALQLDALSTGLGRWLLGFPRLLSIGTYSVWALELVVPFLILSPWRNPLLRTLSIVAMIGLHGILAATLHLGHFSFVCIAGWIGLLPTEVLDRLWPSSAKGAAPAVVFQPRAATILGGSLIALSGAWNLSTLDLGIALPEPVMAVARIARVEQRWNLFAPDPKQNDGWFVIVGDGKLDVFHPERPLSLDKPSDVAATYVDMRWRKYLMNLVPEGNRGHRVELLQYLCRAWPKSHGAPLTRVELVYVEEASLPNGPAPPQPRSMFVLECAR